MRYGGDLAGARLTLRGIDPEIIAPVKLEDVDIATARERNGAILAFLPMLLIWMALIGGMPLALDSTAGERERASLEPLLLNPISSTSVIVGKWLAAALLSSFGLLLAAGSSMLTLRIIPWHELGMQIHVTDGALWLSVLVMLPVALLMSAAVMLVSALSRSFQQAQSYSGVLMIVALVPSILTVVLPVFTASWAMALPIVGQLSMTRDILTGQASQTLLPVLAVAGTILPALVLIALATRLVRREAIVFRSE
jgi:sodium transport system permease protein